MIQFILLLMAGRALWLWHLEPIFHGLTIITYFTYVLLKGYRKYYGSAGGKIAWLAGFCFIPELFLRMGLLIGTGILFDIWILSSFSGYQSDTAYLVLNAFLGLHTLSGRYLTMIPVALKQKRLNNQLKKQKKEQQIYESSYQTNDHRLMQAYEQWVVQWASEMKLNQLDFAHVEQPIDDSLSYQMTPTGGVVTQPLATKWMDNDEKLIHYQTLPARLKSLIEQSQGVAMPSLQGKPVDEQFQLVFEGMIQQVESFRLPSIQCSTHEGQITIHRVNAVNDWMVTYLKTRQKQLIFDYQSMRVGYEGEQAVNEELKIHRNLINLTNIRVEVEGESVENDNIVLSPYGIFTLEVKNMGLLGRFDLVIESDGRWLRQFQDGRQEVMKNIGAQNTRHIAYLNQLINNELGTTLDDFINVQGVIVLANERVGIVNHNPRQTVIRKTDIYAHITSHPICFTEAQLRQIEAILMQHALPPQFFPVISIEEEVVQLVETFGAQFESLQMQCVRPYQQAKEELNAQYEAGLPFH